jgi:uncharacterized membrane protein YidH (DUF202 family)
MHPEDVRAVPYWVDDASLRQSILASGGGRILVRSDLSQKEKKMLKHPGSGPGANQVYDHLLPFGDIESNKIDTATGRTSYSKDASKGIIDNSRKYDVGTKIERSNEVNLYTSNDDDDYYMVDEDEDEDVTCMGWMFPFCSPSNNMSVIAPTSVQKIEPKVFFANERTFLHWLHAGITLYTIASGILVFSEKSNSSWAEWYAMALLPLSLGFCMYALHIFLWRADRIKTRIPGRWDDPRGPYLLGGLLVLVLSVSLASKMYQFWNFETFEEL